MGEGGEYFVYGVLMDGIFYMLIVRKLARTNVKINKENSAARF